MGFCISYTSRSYPHFDHGYAVTSHSAQGITADRVMINADLALHSPLLNSRFAYVAISRARLDVELYTNSATKLGLRLSAEMGKSSAVEPSQSVGISVTRDSEIGQSV